jgi:hypothetical protein
MCRFGLLLALIAELCNGTARSQNRLTRFGTVTFPCFTLYATIQIEFLSGLVNVRPRRVGPQTHLDVAGRGSSLATAIAESAAI